jgi:integrase
VASYVRHGSGWRAHIYVRGVRESKLFRTKRESDLQSGVSALTFAEAAERWLTWKVPRLENVVNQRTVEQSIRDHVLPSIGHVKLTDLKRKDLIKVVTEIAEKGRVETAHRVGQRIRAIFDHAVDHGDIESHPAAGLSRVLPAREHRHMRAVDREELPQLMRDIQSYPEPVTRSGLLLMAHTFVRTSELIGARWEEFQNDIWVVPGERMKMGKPHVVPLSTQVRGLLDELRPISDECPYVLPSRSYVTASISNNTLLFALYRLGYRGRMTGHGFRSLASTILNESGKWSKDAIERQLAHRETDEVREAYHRAQYLDERRRMMQFWSDHLAASASSTQR